MATCPKCKRDAWQTRGGMGGGIIVDNEDQCLTRGGRDCRIAESGGRAALRAESERYANLTHPQLIESLYAARDAAQSERDDLLAERDGLHSILTQQGREHERFRTRIAAAIRAEQELLGPEDEGSEALARLLAVVEGG